jgi:hypothetical protein
VILKLKLFVIVDSLGSEQNPSVKLPIPAPVMPTVPLYDEQQQQQQQQQRTPTKHRLSSRTTNELIDDDDDDDDDDEGDDPKIINASTYVISISICIHMSTPQ